MFASIDELWESSMKGDGKGEGLCYCKLNQS